MLAISTPLPVGGKHTIPSARADVPLRRAISVTDFDYGIRCPADGRQRERRDDNDRRAHAQRVAHITAYRSRIIIWPAARLACAVGVKNNTCCINN